MSGDLEVPISHGGSHLGVVPAEDKQWAGGLVGGGPFPAIGPGEKLS